MTTPNTRPILVTGTQRSGSTWVGQMLAAHTRVAYVWEPFNKAVPNSPVRYWYQHVTAEDEAAFRKYLRPLLTHDYPWWDEVRASPTPRRIAGATWRALRALWRRQVGCRVLMKDPSALFSAEWLERTYGMDVVVLIRHPAAFVSSMKRLDWWLSLGELVPQTKLLDTLLRPLSEEMRRAEPRCADIIDHSILTWRLMHHVIRHYRETHPGWIFLRHEDLSLDPLGEFEKLFARLGLDMTGRVRRTIAEHSAEENPREAPHKKAHQLKRNSRANVWNWRSRLTPEEIERVRAGTDDVARHFYSDADWNPPAEPLAA
jgi:hypothetical protein